MRRSYMLTTDDCLRACIASLIEVDTADVPHFHEDDEATDQQVTDAINKYLRTWGLKKFGLAWHALHVSRDMLMENMHLNNPGVNYLLFGETMDRQPHVVVCRDREIYHDPAPWQPGVHFPHMEIWTVVILIPEILCYA